MKKVFLIDKTASVNIVKSQLLTPLELFSHANYILIAPKEFKSVLKAYNLKGEIILYGSIFAKYMNIIMGKSLNQIYTRSLLEFVFLYVVKKVFIKKWNILFDFRGLASDECFIRDGKTIRADVLKKLEGFVCSRANKLQTVSHSFSHYLRDKYKVNKEINVVPCCITSSEFVEKPNYNNGDILSFVYLGGLSKWQKFEYTLDVYNKISEHHNSKLSIITSNPNKASEILIKKNIKADVKSLDQKDVAKELRKHDFGFLLRDDLLLNNIASPVKFLEYTSNGVIPIISKNIGDYSDVVLQEGIGVIETNDIEKLVSDIINIKLEPTIQSKLHKMSMRYTWDKYLDKIQC